jgi:hypothetical protein
VSSCKHLVNAATAEEASIGCASGTGLLVPLAPCAPLTELRRIQVRLVTLRCLFVVTLLCKVGRMPSRFHLYNPLQIALDFFIHEPLSSQRPAKIDRSRAPSVELRRVDVNALVKTHRHLPTCRPHYSADKLHSDILGLTRWNNLLTAV